MTSISLLCMGKIKKRNVREAIISILGKEYPLSIRKIFNIVKKEYNLYVSYQAVFKTIKELVGDKILIENDREYKLNINWIIELENEINQLKNNYQKTEQIASESVQECINKFICEVAPKIKDYIGINKACIYAISGGGRFFGTALLKYLLREGLDATYIELDKNDDKHLFKKSDVENKKLILVDSEVYSGATFRSVIARINKIKKKFNIIDIKLAVDRDVQGISDFSRTH